MPAVVGIAINGNIGFVAAGRVPVRKPENDLKGLAPAPGWLAQYDWAGFIPFAELRFHSIFTEGDKTNFVPVVFGIRF